MAKRFFFVCAGLFLLALSYHLGARSATAQAGATGFAFSVSGPIACVMTPNGDVYARYTGNVAQPGTLDAAPPAARLGNFWGGATGAQPQTWGQVKDRYHK